MKDISIILAFTLAVFFIGFNAGKYNCRKSHEDTPPRVYYDNYNEMQDLLQYYLVASKMIRDYECLWHTLKRDKPKWQEYIELEQKIANFNINFQGYKEGIDPRVIEVIE